MIAIGLSSAAFYGENNTEDQVRSLLNYPVEVCEVFLQTFGEYTPAFGLQLRRELGDVRCLAVHPKSTQLEGELFGKSPRQREEAIEMFAGACLAGKMLGARYYVFHGPFSVDKNITPERIFRLEENMQVLYDIAGREGIELLWENVSWAALSTPKSVEEIRRRLPRQRYVLDVKQAFRAGVDPIDMIDAMGDRLAHVHALDWDEKGNLCLPGEGVLDWQALMRHLADVGYDGAVILEPYGWMSGDHQRMMRSLEYLRRCAEKANA
ncbi:MAG: sugar phosphate isomerase/epimerase [Clostridiales bacterium]|nr:sugar phosphate isomerase/epimerase [Clostridiales bacterium]